MRNSNGRRAHARRLTTALAAAAAAGALAPALPATAAAELPDGRAYEMVSPADKGGYEISASAYGGWGWAGTTGERIIYGLYANIEGNPSGNLSMSPLKATRTPSGWSTGALLPRPVPDSQLPLGSGSGMLDLPTPDLSRVAVTSTLPAAPGAANRLWNLFDQDVDGTFSLLVPRLTEISGDWPVSGLVGRSADGSSAVVDTFNQLTPDAPAGVENLFELVDGRARMVGIRPDGTPFPGGVTAPSPDADFNPIALPFQNAISADGSRIVFRDASNTHLYVRIDGERTVALPELPVGALTNGRQTFYYATPDGSKIAFTNGTNTNLGVPYLYDVATNTATNLIDGLGGPATPISSIIALSDDGRYVYFGGNQIASTGAPTGRSIYVWHDGTVRYVGPLTPLSGGSDEPAARTSFASADGGAFVFQTTATVRGFAATSPATLRVFRYDAPSGEITCVSCLPDGTASGVDADAGMVAFGIFKMFSNRLQNSVSDDGRRVFFQTEARLLAADENDRYDVYQWQDEELSLISSGRSTSDSYFGDASPDGDDVFFFTRAQLVPEDSDDAMDLYDARVGGGLPSRVPAEPDRSCGADGCQGPGDRPTRLDDARQREHAERRQRRRPDRAGCAGPVRAVPDEARQAGARTAGEARRADGPLRGQPRGEGDAAAAGAPRRSLGRGRLGDAHGQTRRQHDGDRQARGEGARAARHDAQAGGADRGPRRRRRRTPAADGQGQGRRAQEGQGQWLIEPIERRMRVQRSATAARRLVAGLGATVALGLAAAPAQAATVPAWDLNVAAAPTHLAPGQNRQARRARVQRRLGRARQLADHADRETAG